MLRLFQMIINAHQPMTPMISISLSCPMSLIFWITTIYDRVNLAWFRTSNWVHEAPHASKYMHMVVWKSLKCSFRVWASIQITVTSTWSSRWDNQCQTKNAKPTRLRFLCIFSFSSGFSLVAIWCSSWHSVQRELLEQIRSCLTISRLQKLHEPFSFFQEDFTWDTNSPVLSNVRLMSPYAI